MGISALNSKFSIFTCLTYITHKQWFTMCSLQCKESFTQRQHEWQLITNGQWMMKWKLLSRHMLVWSVSTSRLIFKAKEKRSKNSKFKIQSRVWQHTLGLVFSSTCCEIHTGNYIDKICASSGAQLVAIGLTVLAWVQTKRSSLQHSSILADVPDVEVYKDRDGGKTSNSKPSQHEDVCQHDELQGKTQVAFVVHYICYIVKEIDVNYPICSILVHFYTNNV